MRFITYWILKNEAYCQKKKESISAHTKSSKEKSLELQKAELRFMHLLQNVLSQLSHLFI